MIGSRITIRDNLGHITLLVEEQARAGLNAAAREAAAVIQQNASFDLELEVLPARPVPGGFASGVESRKRGRDSNVRLAPIFDGGSLGKRRRKLKSARKDSWNVSRGGSDYTAQRHEITAEMGVAAQNFFAKGRRAGREALIANFHRGL